MIATLNGVISEVLPDVVILEVGGIGYGVYMTTEDQGRVGKGNETKLFIYEHIR